MNDGMKQGLKDSKRAQSVNQIAGRTEDLLESGYKTVSQMDIHETMKGFQILL